MSASSIPRIDPLSQVDAYGDARAEIGLSALGRPVYSPYRPTVVSLASELTHLKESPEIQVEMCVPVPEGMSFAGNSATGQLQLSLNPMYARRFRRVSGYLGEIRISLMRRARFRGTPRFFSCFHSDSFLLDRFGALFRP